MDRTEKLMKAFTEAHGVSGFESEIAGLMESHLADVAGIEKDRLGSFIARMGDGGPRVMLTAHMDEVGFMVSHFTGRFVRFNRMGGWWTPRMIGLPVKVRTSKGDIAGVVASKSPFFMETKERKEIPKADDLFIDVGLVGEEEPESIGIVPGDPIIPDFPFTILEGGRSYLAKAWDDRVGCVMIVEALRSLSGETLPNTLFGVGTVQEEVGIRGAQTSGNYVDPDVCIALEVNLAQDIPGSKEGRPEKLGEGVSIYVYDSSLIPNSKLRDLVAEVAKEKKIPYHYSALPVGGTDGGKVHLNRHGVPSIVIGVPTRYIHSGAGIIHRPDYDAALELVVETVRRLDAERVQGLV